jgi:hypothetical protein
LLGSIVASLLSQQRRSDERRTLGGSGRSPEADREVWLDDRTEHAGHATVDPARRVDDRCTFDGEVPATRSGGKIARRRYRDDDSDLSVARNSASAEPSQVI